MLVAAAVLLALDWSGPGGVLPDTEGYLRFDPLRQPLYGLWANGAHALLGSWPGVGLMQIGLLAVALVFFWRTLWSSGTLGPAGVVVSAVGVALLLKLGIGSMVPALISEGVFIPLFTLLPALAIRLSQRGPRDWSAFAACLVLVALTQIRTAALASLILPVAAIGLWWLSRIACEAALRRAIVLAAAFALMLCLAPMVLGKKAFQLGTQGDALGFALLPRIGQLQIGSPETPPLWQELSSSWQHQALGLDWTESALFDGQIQEAILFQLGPPILFGAQSGSATSFNWSREQDRLRARELSLRWMRERPQDYALWSLRHAVGTLTAATYASQSQRQRVWAAVRAVDPRVWQLAVLRDDYPNNRFAEPLKPATAVVYSSIRVFASAAAILGIAACLWVVVAAVRRLRVLAGVAVAAMGFAWLALHAATVGLTVFPESRFVLLTLWGYVLFGVAAAVLIGNELLRRRVR